MRAIQFHGQQIKFPPVCACCLNPVYKEYKFEKMFTYGRNSFIMQLPVPLCHQHYQHAEAQSPAQIWCERIGVAVGGAFGLAVLLGLLRYWAVTEQGNLFLNIFLALIIGTGMFIIIWATAKFWLAPLFAFPETKSVFNSVRMTKFDPTRQILEIRFENETVAELTARENLSILVLEEENQ